MSVSLVVALDFPRAKDALALAGQLRGLAPWMKVGLELFTAAGPPVVIALKDMGFKVFLDLKLHDIPNTVAGAVMSATRLGADMTTLHHAGGKRMAQAALNAVNECGSAMLPFAVTVLTSASEAESGAAGSMAAFVAAKAKEAQDWGLPGVVCSGHEAAAVKAACGQDFLCLCPGIRLAGAGRDDQRRIMTPQEAVTAGADFLVVGRPITAAAEPKNAAHAILSSMNAGMRDPAYCGQAQSLP